MRSKAKTVRMIGCMAAPLAAVVAATLAAVPAIQAATYTSVSAGGDWQTNSTWGASSTSYPGGTAGDIANISSGSPVTLSGTVANDLGNVNIAAGGTLELNSGASIPGQTTNAGFNVGNSGTGTGTLDVAGGSGSYVYNLSVGGNASEGGYVNQTGGTLTVVSGAALRGNNGTYLISGGTLDLPGYYDGATGVSGETFTLDVAGGKVNSSHYSYVSDGAANGAITVNSGTFNNTAGFHVAHSTGTGTVSLNGGTFETNQGIVGSDSTGSSYINFNGGTLQATANITGGTSSLLSNFTAANVQNGGAVFDTNGNTVTVSQNLISDPTSPSVTDGGLTLNDSSTGPKGELILSGTGNTYNGNTTVNAGTLQIDSAFLASTSTVSIASGALMDLSYSGTDTVNALYLNGVAQANGVYGASSLGSTTLAVTAP